MALPQLAALLVVAACLWVFYWRRNPARYVPPAPLKPRNRRVFLAASAACGVFIVGTRGRVSASTGWRRSARPGWSWRS